jgi:hypothetical protein
MPMLRVRSPHNFFNSSSFSQLIRNSDLIFAPMNTLEVDWFPMDGRIHVGLDPQPISSTR